jgi:2',3'-cyclic-nucleotide 2'-phosphodiesterase (5'-nucleotidase family)
VTTVNNRKIGFIGATNGDLATTSSPGANVFVNANLTVEDYLRRAINDLTTTYPDCNIIILLSAARSDELSSIVARVQDIDLVVASNEGILFHNGATLTQLSYTPQSYPQLVTNIYGQVIPIVQAGENGIFIGHIDVCHTRSHVASYLLRPFALFFILICGCNTR